MSDALKNQYDSLYASSDGAYRNGEPLELLAQLKTYRPSGTVLDVGGGEGVNAVQLAKQGYDVTIADFSEVGLKKAQERAGEQGVKIRTVLTDVTTEDFVEFFDIFLFSYLFFHLDTATALRVIENAKAQTNPRGIHVVVTFANHGGLYERAKGKGRFYPSETDLRTLYANWHLLHLWTEEVASLATDKNGVPLKNTAVGIIARCPD